MRDTQENYVALERLFGYLTSGMAFGQSALINYYESKTRFYNAYAVSETVVLKI